MPILLQCDELEPGMRLYESIMLRHRMLLAGGKVLTHADVDVLRHRYASLWVRVGDPLLDNVVEFEDDSHDREVASTVQSRIAQSMREVSERFSSRASLKTINFNAIHDTVADVMRYLQDNPVSAALLSRTLGAGSPLTEHAGNVFYLSMILGCAVRDYVVVERQRTSKCRWLDLQVTMDMLPLGLGAMFIDVGMLPLHYLHSKKGPLSAEDRQAIRDHPASGAEMLPYDLSPTARAIVRTHHENVDGSGYPAGMEGYQVHIFSRIVRIADAYAAATASHVYKEAKSPARALWEMSLGPYSPFYDPVLMKVFTRLIQPFPIGAKLRLRDGRHAVVVQYNRQDPFKPTVVIAFDINGKPLPPSHLEGPFRLSDRPDLRILSFGGEQLSYLFSPTFEDETITLPGNFRTLFEAAYP